MQFFLRKRVLFFRVPLLRMVFTVLFLGDYKVDVKYRNQAIPGSVFTAKAWDASAVIVTNIRPGRMGKPNYFNGENCRLLCRMIVA